MHAAFRAGGQEHLRFTRGAKSYQTICAYPWGPGAKDLALSGDLPRPAVETLVSGV